MKRYVVVIMLRAFHDMVELQEFIAIRSPLNAERFIARLRREIETLADVGPGFERIPEELDLGYDVFQLIVWPYRVIYRVRGDIVEVMHVCHGSRHSIRRRDLPH